MSAKSGRDRHLRDETRQGRTHWPAVLRAGTLGGAVALVIAGTLLPSESTVAEGSYAPLAAGWCLLLVAWAVAMWLDEQATVKWGWTELAGAALISWHSLAAIAALGSTNGRQALNILWLVIGYGLAVFLLRQTLQTAAQVRGLVVAMIWLATLLASFGFYQYFYSMPRLRQAYEANPEKVLLENGYSTDKNSPERILLENRLRSVEPLATFSLTNSLAGYLAPWLIATAGLGFYTLRDRSQRRAAMAFVLVAAGLGACLLLTKSRTAYLATLAGAVLLGIYGRRSGWQLSWRIPAVAALGVLVLSLFAVWLGGLDAKVLSEAPKSVLYRVQYWQATAALIADDPIFGCGPGNFQEAYAAYKLPEASETVRDPHNFLLEIWATAGTPALVLLLLLMMAFVADLTSGTRSSSKAAGTLHLSSAAHGVRRESEPGTKAVWVGALVGLVGAAPLGSLVGFPLDNIEGPLGIPVVWLLGGPLLAAVWWVSGDWLARGSLSLAVLLIPVIVLLINLLAAGAVVFPGVIGTILALTPAALASQFRQSSERADSWRTGLPREIQVSRYGGSLTLAAFVLSGLCLWTEYLPVLQARGKQGQAMDALRSGDPGAAEAAAQAAASADRLWPEPHRLLAEMRLQRWLVTSREADWQSFVEAADRFCRLNPRHHLAWHARGNWYLAAWRKLGRKGDFEEAIRGYRQAIVCYPNRALYHAQLAWVLHSAGDDRQAAEEAAVASRLDDSMPHSEQKLSRQQIYDPQFGQQGTTWVRSESAELTVQRLRTTEREKSP